MQEEGLKEPVSWYCKKIKSSKCKVEKWKLVFKHFSSFFLATPKCLMCNYVSRHICHVISHFQLHTTPTILHFLFPFICHWWCTFFHYWYHCLCIKSMLVPKRWKAWGIYHPYLTRPSRLVDNTCKHDWKSHICCNITPSKTYVLDMGGWTTIQIFINISNIFKWEWDSKVLNI